MNKTNTFTPFSTHGLILTDAHGNELTIENDTQEMAVYGQWQGSAQSPAFQDLVGALQSMGAALAPFKDKKSEGAEKTEFKVSKKKEEISIDFDFQITKDSDSFVNIQNLLSKIEQVQAKTNKP